MQTIVAMLHARFADAIREALGIDVDPLIGLSQNPQFGDYQSNAAMGLAKLVGETTGQKTNPRAVAEQIKAKLNISDIAADVTIAGPGFINVRLSPTWLSTQLNTIAAAGEFIPKAATPQTVVVDYSGVNIAKEMHVGHLRSTIIGDAIANVLQELGHQVVRRNHIGDWGTQFGMLIQRKLQKGSGIGQIQDLEQEYREAKAAYDHDQTFAANARQTVVMLQQGDENTRNIWSIIVDETRRHYQPIYQRLHVRLKPEDERGESFYNDKLADVVKELRDKAIAVDSDGAVCVFTDGEGKTPLIIQKSDGGYLYGTTDLAAIHYRINEEHADRIIYTHDSRQAQHFSQVFRTAEKAGWTRDGQVKLEYAPFGTMLGQDGKPFKTRSGDTVKLKELLDEAELRGYNLAKEKDAERVAKAKERGDSDAAPMPEERLRDIGRAVGIGAVKYADLSKDRTSDYVFNWDQMLSFEGNTAPYLQYVYARIQSIFRKAAGSAGGASIRLDAPHEQSLAKHILRLGEVIELVGRELKPHLLATYLYDLATRFSGFYENCPVLSSDEPTKSSRLALCRLTAGTMATGLDLLGIDHPDQM